MAENKVSIVIPVYNVEQYFDYCMQSIFAQDYSDLEIILVDDGSTDSSGRMCDEYASKDARVKVIHKNNSGQSSARNVGIKEATGDYLTFVDSDDYIRKDYISSLIKYALTDKTDLVVFSYKKTVSDVDYSLIPKENICHHIYNREEIRFEMVSRHIPMYPVSKLYNRELIRYLHFPEGCLFEEIPTNWQILKYVNKVTYVDAEIYYYRQRTGSTVNSDYKHSRMDQIIFSKQIYDEVADNEKLKIAAGMRCFFAAADTYALVTKDYPEDIKIIKETIKRHRDEVLKMHGNSALKIMALCSYISTQFVRLFGRMYKKYNHLRWKRAK